MYTAAAALGMNCRAYARPGPGSGRCPARTRDSASARACGSSGGTRTPRPGKGTQGALTAAHFDIPHIATGELLRDHVARRTVSAWPSSVSRPGANSCPTRLCSTRCGRGWSAAGGGFVLDGIPRNMHQARAAYLIGRELGMTADVALQLQVDDRELMRRLLARAALERRSDDTADIA